MLPRGQPDPGGDLSAILEVMPVADAGQQRAGGNGADAGALHQAFASFIFARRTGNRFVVVGNAQIELIGVR